MSCTILPVPCAAGALLPIVPRKVPDVVTHQLMEGALPQGAGWELSLNKQPLFRIAGHAWIPDADDGISAPLLVAQHDIPDSGPIQLEARKNGHALAVITLSDKGSQGLREDTAGPLAARTIANAIPVCLSRHFILPDDCNLLRGLLAELALIHKYDLICTCGGTGVSPRDITPQATLSMLDYELPGFGEAMRSASLAKTANAIISRAISGVLGSCLIVNLPGSARAVAENLAAVLPALNHALEKLQGNPADCGG